jgi:cobyric acid synthase
MPVDLAVLGVASGSGKTVVTCGLLRLLANSGVRAVPLKSLAVVQDAPISHVFDDVVGRHCRAARTARQDWMTPLVLSGDNGDTPLLRTGSTVLGRARCLDSDTAWLPDLPDDVIAIADRKVRDAARQAWAASDVVVVEGSGGVLDVIPDIANTTAAAELAANVVLVANVRLGGYAAGLAGAYFLLPESIQSRVAGYVLCNVPPAIELDTVADHLLRRAGLRMLGTIGHVQGLTRSGPPPDDVVFETLAAEVAATDLPSLVLDRVARPLAGA